MDHFSRNTLSKESVETEKGSESGLEFSMHKEVYRDIGD